MAKVKCHYQVGDWVWVPVWSKERRGVSRHQIIFSTDYMFDGDFTKTFQIIGLCLGSYILHVPQKDYVSFIGDSFISHPGFEESTTPTYNSRAIISHFQTQPTCPGCRGYCLTCLKYIEEV